MKKLSLIFAMAMATSFAMAQIPELLEPTLPVITKISTPAFNANTTTTTQTGDNNAVDVSQTGVNSATISQISIIGATVGKANIATLTQGGTQNVANIDQNRSGGQQGSSTVTTGIQSGNKNYMNVIQDGYYQGGNAATVTQIGITGENAKGNQADINKQQGYENNWIIYQNGDDNKAQQISTSSVVSRTTNKITQYGSSNNAVQKTAGGDAMYATITQGTATLGATGNIAEQIQAGLKSQANITQLTNNNKAYQTQVNGSYYFNGVYASQHDAKITQQGGDGNYALQYQTELVSNVWGNSKNTSEIMQDGSDNRAEVAQLDGLNKGDITQSGNNDQALLIQKGLSNTADVLQKEGSNNIANLTQSDGAIADIDQVGSHNTLKGIGVTMATSLNGSNLDLLQSGSYNTLSLDQANGAIATVNQLGSSNTSSVYQH